MNDLLKFVAVSAVTLTAVETLLVLTRQPMYTYMYQNVRCHESRLVKHVPVALTILCVAHLEDIIPHKIDPFYLMMDTVRRIT